MRLRIGHVLIVPVEGVESRLAIKKQKLQKTVQKLENLNADTLMSKHDGKLSPPRRQHSSTTLSTQSSESSRLSPCDSSMS